MKKVSKILTFIFISSMFFTACQKEELTNAVVEETQTPEVFYKSNRLAFNSIESYDNILDNLSKPETLKRLEQLNENPLRTLKKSLNQDEELYDDFLLSILNEDKIVQIGEWIIKVDMEHELVSVISVDNIGLMENLIDGVDNEGIYKFTTEDEVLELLEVGVRGTISTSLKKIPWWKRCKERKANAKIDKDGPSFIGLSYFVRYYRAGIYFSLFAKTEISKQWFGGPLRIDIYGSYKFEDRCDRSYSRTWRSAWNAGTMNNRGDKVVLKVYAHRKTLRQYKLEAGFKTTWMDQGTTDYSRTYRISDGY